VDDVRLGKRTARLVREAAVLGFVEGAWWRGGHTTAADARADYPKDADVLAWVMRSARSNRDLYPLLSNVDDDNPGGDRA